MTKQTKVKYKITGGKLSIEHNILLQQLTFRKKTKNNKDNIYYSYFIKLPRAIYTLLKPTDDTVYMKYEEDKIILSPHVMDMAKKVKIQIDNKSLTDNPREHRYKLTIPRKFIDTQDYQRQKSYITLTITAEDNKEGYNITLKQKQIG